MIEEYTPVVVARPPPRRICFEGDEDAQPAANYLSMQTVRTWRVAEFMDKVSRKDERRNAPIHDGSCFEAANFQNRTFRHRDIV